MAFDPMASYAIDDERLFATNDLAKAKQAAPFDTVFLLDVLEHVPDEKELLGNVSALLAKNGSLFVTVPAFQFLFSEHDIFLKHFRRYGRSNLRLALEQSGFRVEKIWYFYASLFSARLAQKILAATTKPKGQSQEGVGAWPHAEDNAITRFLRLVLRIDFAICKNLSLIGIPLPGLSIFAVCKKNSV